MDEEFDATATDSNVSDSLDDLLNRIENFNENNEISESVSYVSHEPLTISNDEEESEASTIEEKRLERKPFNWRGKHGSIPEGVNVWLSVIGKIKLDSIPMEKRKFKGKKLKKVEPLSKQKRALVMKLWKKAKTQSFCVGKLYPKELRRINSDLTRLEKFDFQVYDHHIPYIGFLQLCRPQSDELIQVSEGVTVDKETPFKLVCEKLFQEKNVRLIMGEHCCMIHHQTLAAKVSPVPVIMSPMVLAPVLFEGFNNEWEEEIVSIVTNEERIGTAWPESLSQCYIRGSTKERIINIGLEMTKYSNFKAYVNAPEKDHKKMLERCLKLLQKKKRKFKDNAMACILCSPKLLKIAAHIKLHFKLPVYDHLSIVNSIGHAFEGYTTPSVREMRFRIGLKKIKVIRRENAYSDCVGILSVAGNRDTHSILRVKTHCGVEFRSLSLPGLSYKRMTGDKLRSTCLDTAIHLINQLQEKEGVCMMIGANSLFHAYGKKLKKDIATIFYPSMLSVLPLCMSMFNPKAKILVLTSELYMVSMKWRQLLKTVLLSRNDVDRIVLEGFQRWDDQPGGITLAEAEIMIIEMVTEQMKKFNIQAIIVESYNLMPFSNTLRKLFNVYVFDHMFLTDLVASGFGDSPKFPLETEEMSSHSEESYFDKRTMKGKEEKEKEEEDPQRDWITEELDEDGEVVQEDDKSKPPSIDETLLKNVKRTYSKLKEKKKQKGTETLDFSLFNNGKTEKKNEIRKRKEKDYQKGKKEKIKHLQKHISRYSRLVNFIDNKKYDINLQPEWMEKDFDRYYEGLADSSVSGSGSNENSSSFGSSEYDS